MPLARLFVVPLIQLFVAILATIPTAAQTNPYESDIRAFEAADRVSPPPVYPVLFIGSSSIVNWRTVAADFPRYNVLNRGFGGSQTSDVLYFFDRIVVPYHPPLIVFYEGDNDIAAGKTVEQVFNDWTNFVGQVREKLPNTHVLYISVKPSPSRAGDLPEQRAVNERIRDYTEADSKLHFADVFNPMLTASGDFRPEFYVSDQLHMTEAGYDIWRSVVAPLIDEIANQYPIQITRPESNSLLIDFGSAGLASGAGANLSTYWNNISATLAGNNSGTLANLVTSSGSSSSVTFRMVSRFNGANENGTLASTSFPASATRDSLFGNTETFNGLANITPVFKLTNLPAAQTFRFTFYASRTGVSDNRETRYTVTGATSASADLNVANNTDSSVTVSGIAPDENGEITVALAPGPQNNNGNHFIYLGVLAVESVEPAGLSFLFDFGASSSPTDTQNGAPGLSWNNLTPEIGATDSGLLAELVATNGAATPIALKMISRFNGANENGAGAANVYPSSATQDSLFGNTESFNGLANITPRFELQNLNSAATYSFTFYASRTGVSDNRQTRYTVTGAATAVADLDPSNNTNAVVTIAGVKPDASGAIAFALSAGPENNNSSHFTYLGALQANWSTAADPVPIQLTASRAADDLINIRIDGVAGMTYELQSSKDFQTWQKVQFVSLATSSTTLPISLTGPAVFFRLETP